MKRAKTLGEELFGQTPRGFSVDILLPHILPIQNPKEFKLHLACWNGLDQPLDVFVRNREEWDGWSRWRGTRDDFSRACIFSLIDFYPEKDHWLFGGAYRITTRRKIERGEGYDIEPLKEFSALIGRLKLRLKRPGRAKAFNFENHYGKLVVVEISPQPYAGEAFPGYEGIDIGFSTLEALVKADRPDWKAALRNSKGVYLITDTSNGKRYVGSAYGDTGLWSRWACYVQTGHGYNDELTKLIKENGRDYARRNFRFSLLEQRLIKADDQEVIKREQFWKQVLLTGTEYGYNKN